MKQRAAREVTNVSRIAQHLRRAGCGHAPCSAADATAMLQRLRSHCGATASAGDFEIAETQTWQRQTQTWQRQKQHTAVYKTLPRLSHRCQRNRRAQKLLSTILSASCSRLMTCLSSSTSSSNAAASGAASTARRSCSAACKADQGSNLHTCIKLLPSSCQASKSPTSQFVWHSLRLPQTPCAWPWP